MLRTDYFSSFSFFSLKMTSSRKWRW